MELRRWGHGWGRFIAAAVAGGTFGATLLGQASDAWAQGFPYGSELVLDASPMRGSKKIPVLDIQENGAAEIDLWCNTVKARLVVAANTITIITGEMSSRQCPPDRARADEDLLAALNEATTWRMESEALIFMGGRTLRFRVQTN
jgi:heat shock protein HslJ